MVLIIIIHVIACISLIGLILVQRGRGGGLVDSLQGLETVFGTKTSAFLTKTTSLMATVFFCTCLSLAFFSLQQGRSLVKNAPVPPMRNSLMNTTEKTTEAPVVPATQSAPVQSAPVAQSVPVQSAPAAQSAPVAEVQNTTAK